MTGAPWVHDAMRRAAPAALAALACSRSTPASDVIPPGALAAVLVDHDTIDLTWTQRATEGGGAWIELATPGDDFVKLDAVWPGTTTYRHDSAAPGTTFLYRLRPFFGRVSNTARATTGRATSDAIADEGPLASVSGGTGTVPLRAHETIAAAAPGELTAALSSPTSVDLRWRDRAGDEDGYLVELSADGVNFAICALLPADSTSFRKSHLPAETALIFRVRAFFYGEPSRQVAVTTPGV